MCLQYKSFENTAHYEQFLLFPIVFSTNLDNFMPFSSNSKLSESSFGLEQSKICHLGKGYAIFHNIFLRVIDYVDYG